MLDARIIIGQSYRMKKPLDLKALRKRLALTQEQMAERLGIERSHLSRLERGERTTKGPVKLLFEIIREAST